MTAPTPIPAAETAPHMVHTPDTAPQAPPEQARPAQARAAAAARPGLFAQAAENPLLSFFGLLVVALLAAAIASPNIRINDTNRRIDRLEDKMTAKFDALDAKFDAKFDALDAKFDAKFDALDAKFDAKFDELEAKFDEMNLKLTALIAKLNATADVNAALEGRLTDVESASADGPDPASPDEDS